MIVAQKTLSLIDGRFPQTFGCFVLQNHLRFCGTGVYKTNWISRLSSYWLSLKHSRCANYLFLLDSSLLLYPLPMSFKRGRSVALSRGAMVRKKKSLIALGDLAFFNVIAFGVKGFMPGCDHDRLQFLRLFYTGFSNSCKSKKILERKVVFFV